MSTSLLYHAFGTINYRYVKTEYGQGRVVFHLEKKREKQRCVVCRSKQVTHYGGNSYSIRTVPIGKMPTWLHLSLKNLKCEECGACRQESREVADPRKTYTRKLARLVLELVQRMTINDVARYLKMGWHQVRDIVQADLEKKEARRSWRHVRLLAIDEIAVRKGHRYMTVVVDLESGMVLDAVDGRRAESLEPVFSRLRRAGAEIKAVAVDMSSAYTKAITTYAPTATIVHDPFHIVQAANKALDDVRRVEQARLEKDNRKVIKGNRFLLLKGWEKLEDDDRQISKLEEMFALNEPLYRAYLLKEDLRQIWDQGSKLEAEKFMTSWIEEAERLDLPPIKRLAKTLSERREGILAWYDYRITTGPLEGLNNKIKVLKRRAYGYRNQGFFRLLILFSHQKEFCLTGT